MGIKYRNFKSVLLLQTMEGRQVLVSPPIAHPLRFIYPCGNLPGTSERVILSIDPSNQTQTGRSSGSGVGLSLIIESASLFYLVYADSLHIGLEDLKAAIQAWDTAFGVTHLLIENNGLGKVLLAQPPIHCEVVAIIPSINKHARACSVMPAMQSSLILVPTSNGSSSRFQAWANQFPDFGLTRLGADCIDAVTQTFFYLGGMRFEAEYIVTSDIYEVAKDDRKLGFIFRDTNRGKWRFVTAGTNLIQGHAADKHGAIMDLQIVRG